MKLRNPNALTKIDALVDSVKTYFDEEMKRYSIDAELIILDEAEAAGDTCHANSGVFKQLARRPFAATISVVVGDNDIVTEISGDVYTTKYCIMEFLVDCGMNFEYAETCIKTHMMANSMGMLRFYNAKFLGQPADMLRRYRDAWLTDERDTLERSSESYTFSDHMEFYKSRPQYDINEFMGITESMWCDYYVMMHGYV